jgi:hypothetical protein
MFTCVTQCSAKLWTKLWTTNRGLSCILADKCHSHRRPAHGSH